MGNCRFRTSNASDGVWLVDASDQILAAVRAARDAATPLQIAGTGTKSRLLPDTSGGLLQTTEHAGIVQYDPAELVVTARAGTLLKDLYLTLDQHDQTLLCDPPRLGTGGTVGGAISAGLSGPARPWHGAVRDAVLGVEMVNGLGERLTFGGQVMKNVAGYDLPRVMTGAWGCLGVLLQVSLRVAPKWQVQHTVQLHADAAESLRMCRAWARQYLPISGTLWIDGALQVRLSGTIAAVEAAEQEIGGAVMSSNDVWDEVRDHVHPFFRPVSRGGASLWRVVVPPAAAMPDTSDPLAVEWGGGLRWWWHDDSERVLHYAAQHGGWAWAMGSPVQLDPAQSRLMGRIKQSFDPDHVFRSSFAFGGTQDAH